MSLDGPRAILGWGSWGEMVMAILGTLARRFGWGYGRQQLGHELLPALNPTELPRGHIPALDAIRGLAIVVVTLYRFGGGAPDAARSLEPSWLVHSLSHGVDLFFVLSGFLITGILFDAKEQPHYFRNFYARRTLRIFPLYYFALALSLVVLPLVGGSIAAAFSPIAEDQLWLWLYGGNVLQSLRGEWCLGPLNHFWSLAVEEHFYLVWPLVIFSLSRTWAMRVCLATAVAATIARVVWIKAGGNMVAVEVFTLLRLDALSIGSFLALAMRSPEGFKLITRLAWPLLGLAALVMAVMAAKSMRLLGLPMLGWATLSGLLIVVAVTAREGSWIAGVAKSPVLRFFSRYSYGMYVYQNLLIPILAPLVTAPLLAATLGSDAGGQLVYCAIMCAATTVVAMASFHWLEEPLLKLKRFF
ncbi:acyltransferase 3 [Pirellula staleyi DSM 6068]|uniref:Acyltransferase 3 n=1 Tax=Pirellula staleyi (strain ATCC 27377 / DSM 6068 / ICPB 4128) TaxID=530564 RepID=D2R059_PIRSD|nr:acyltransferase 3 [Pirellula staleyi DSM 6068]